MGPYVFIHVALVGFFGFGALHYLWLWWLSRGERLLLAFAAQCAISALLGAAYVGLLTATTIRVAQLGMEWRFSAWILSVAGATWLVSRVTGVRARWFVSPVMTFCVIMAMVSIALPLTGTVTAIGRLTTWWGETLPYPVREPGWVWLVDLGYAVAASSYVFGVVAGVALHRRDRLGSVLVTFASGVSVLALLGSVLVDWLALPWPYLGVRGLAVWTGVFSIVISREYARRGQQVAAAEGQLRHAQKLEALVRMAGGVAHDFNNWLIVINGYSDVLLEQVADHDPRKKSIAAIRSAGGHAADLTQRLLMVSRAHVVEARPLNLDALLGGNRALLQRLVGTGIELEMTLAASGHLVADASQIQQVVMNLVTNARDAMPGGGRVSIATSTVDLEDPLAADCGDLTPGRYIRVTVADTGPGIPVELQSRIFDPFFTTKEAGKGTGLGLSIVDGIVRQNGGAITLRSAIGQGAAFTLYFPQKLGAASADAPATATPADRPPCTETVLVVDDQQPVREFVVDALSSVGYSVLDAGGGDEALAIAAQHAAPIHVLLTDVVMPLMTGPQVADQLKQSRPGLKVLYMSGYSPTLLPGQTLMTPGVAYLAKPFTVKALTAKVRQVIDEHAAEAHHG